MKGIIVVMRIDSFAQEMLYSGRAQANFAESRNGIDESAGKAESRPVEFGEAYRVDISQEAYRKFSEVFSKAQENAGHEIQEQAGSEEDRSVGGTAQRQTGAVNRTEAAASAQMARQKRILEMKGRQVARDSYRESRRLADQQKKLQRAKFLLEGSLRTTQIDTLL